MPPTLFRDYFAIMWLPCVYTYVLIKWEKVDILIIIINYYANIKSHHGKLKSDCEAISPKM